MTFSSFLSAARPGRAVWHWTPMRLVSLLCCAVTALSVAGTLSAQDAPPATAPNRTALRPGDQLVLKVWREPDWSDTLDVDELGQVVLPRLGSVRVSGLSADSLRTFLLTSYAQYLRNPSIELVILRRINVLGAVAKPGLYYLDPTMTVADALAAAGGATGEGKPDRVELRRDGQRLEVKLSQGMQLADTPVQSGDQLHVPQRGWLSRNTWVVATVLGVVTSLTVAAVQ